MPTDDFFFIEVSSGIELSASVVVLCLPAVLLVWRRYIPLIRKQISSIASPALSRNRAGYKRQSSANPSGSNDFRAGAAPFRPKSSAYTGGLSLDDLPQRPHLSRSRDSKCSSLHFVMPSQSEVSSFQFHVPPSSFLPRSPSPPKADVENQAEDLPRAASACALRTKQVDEEWQGCKEEPSNKQRYSR